MKNLKQQQIRAFMDAYDHIPYGKKHNQSILITGLQGTGKTVTFNKLTKNYITQFTLDGALDVKEIEELWGKAKSANSFCIVTTQLRLNQIPHSILDSFKIIECKWVANYSPIIN